MPTQHDWYEALREGRWRPEIEISKDDNGYTATYKQGEMIVSRSSPYTSTQAEGDLMEELHTGTLEGKYFPEG